MTDYLPHTSFPLIQKEGMFHINSDTELLGTFMQIRKSDTVLDIGTNNGALLLYAGMHHPKSLTGIDLFEEVLQTAEINLSMNHMQAELICTPVQKLEHEPFSVIVVNPPYFDTKEDHLKNENAYIRAARHADNLSLEDLFACADRLLNDSGRMYMVHRAVRLQEILALAASHHMKCAALRTAYDHPHGTSKSILLAFRKGRCPSLQILEPAYLNDRTTF